MGGKVFNDYKELRGYPTYIISRPNGNMTKLMFHSNVDGTHAYIVPNTDIMFTWDGKSELVDYTDNSETVKYIADNGVDLRIRVRRPYKGKALNSYYGDDTTLHWDER